MLCSYLDSQLPADVKYPEGKVFAQQHVIFYPNKPPKSPPNPPPHAVIHQVRGTPPHYNIIIAGETINIPKGRNNVFHCILYFIHHVKVKEKGMLGRVNLGLSGINILWVID